MRLTTAVLLVLCSGGIQTPAYAQPATGGVSGIVRNAATQQPVTTATVRLRSTVRSATADAQGAFQFEAVQPGSYVADVRAPGFIPLAVGVRVTAGAVERLELVLVPALKFGEDLVVTATGQPEAPDELVQSVGNVSHEDLTRAKGVGLDETLNTIPGVKAESQAETQEVRVSIRGRGLRTSFGVSGVRVLVDGMPETDATGETSDLTGIDPSALERIEVVKGPMAGQYGASSSGVINLITPRGAATPSLDMTQSFGSYGLRKTQGVLSGTAGPLRFFGSYSDTAQDGYREHSRLDSHHLSTRFDVAPHGFGISVFVRNTSVATQLPGNMTIDEMSANRRAASRLFRAFDARSDIDRTEVGSTVSKATVSHGELTLNVFGGEANFNVPVPFVVLKGHRVMSGGSGRYFVRGSFAGRPNSINAGMDFQRTTEDRNDLVNHFGGARGPEIAREENRLISNASVSLLDTLDVTRALTIRAGVNYSSVKIRIDDFFLDDGDGTGHARFSRASLLGGARYRFSGVVSAFGTATTGFDPPTISAIGRDLDGNGLNTSLKPERSANLEAGINIALRRAISITASAFHMRINDEIVPAGTGVPQQVFVNAAETRHNGLEVAADVPLVNRLRLKAGYTLSGFTYQHFISRGRDVSGNRLPGIPRNRTTLALAYSGPEGIAAGFGWLGNGRMFADDANAYDNAAYRVANLFAGYTRQVRRVRVTAQYRLSNAFNERYVSYLVVNDRFHGYYYPSPERNHGVTLQGGWRF